LTRSHSAWLLNSGGNTESGETLFSSTSKPGTDAALAASDRHGDETGVFAGTWIGGLVSDGSQITYARWTTASDGSVVKSGLWRLSGSKATLIASGTGAVVAAAADAGRVALLRTDGSVAVYAGSGELLERIDGAAPPCTSSQPGPPATGCPGEGVALTGKLVAVLTPSQPGRQAGSIEVFDRTTGELLHTWPHVGGYAWQFDAYRGIAVYARGARVHALDLGSGRDVVVATRNRTIQAARFDRAGLLYGVNGPWSARRGQSGTLFFVPLKTVAARLGH
ncbi:MAG TPA: hypothetical protein VE995_07125, partial [Gaiellaceae bacterium]|nr:hypothetical protein [Gaiellaceae bacterium]